ncbi:MAG: hypothetical protein LUE88_04350 [Clostridiales bacterium]|nr:hypothetical protein [Clostridiales bacterium]
MNYIKYKRDEFVKVEDGGRKVLGLDIQPEKACIFNCIVCNKGQTKYQTQWHDFGTIEDSLENLKEKIAEDKPDLVEIFGQGEVLVNVHLGEIIDCIHEQGIPVRMVTNGYMLGIDGHMELVNKCEEAVGAFGIVDEDAFIKYHRPLPEFNFTAEKQNESIIRFSQQYKGKFKLRVFLSAGYNDSDESVAKLKSVVDRIKYDSLWVASTNKLAVSEERVAQIRDILSA